MCIYTPYLSIFSIFNCSLLYCRSQGLFVSRDDVMNTLRLVDPQGVVMRTPKFKNKRPKKTFFSKGPNYLWSLDGHDKLSGDANCQFDLKIYGYVTFLQV